MKTLARILFFVIGPMLAIFSLLSYRYSSLVGYYYPLESKLGIAIGVGLICSGLILLRKK